MDVTSARPLLLVFAHGVAPIDLGGLAAAQPAATTPVEVTDLPADPGADVLAAHDASDALRRCGVTVDRRDLLLRPRGRSDHGALQALAQRPHGPADVTLLESTFARDLQLLGAVGRSRLAAEVDGWLAAVGDRLRRGDRPEVWLLALGGVETVHTTFDFATAWANAFAWPWRQRLACRVHSDAAVIHAADQRSLDHCATRLRCAPFAGCGTLLLPRAGVLQFLAAPGVAFGRSRRAARACRPERGAALVPQHGEPLPASLTFADFLARFWLRAMAMHGDDPAPQRIARTPRQAARAATWSP